ncbi:MAG: hypothetical protein FWF68_00625 [Spirochaetes bacterium]|nr:hypothetical protein [Spirochaetota bacterium]
MKKENVKKQKPGKAPGSLKKPIEKSKFEKKYTKYIEHPQDKQFFTSCFVFNNNNYTVRDNLTKDDVKRIKNLLKVIKGNRKGAVKLVPLAFAACVVAAVVIFFAVFANPLLERALELGLEAAFEARSDVDNLRLKVVPLSISLSGVTVANRDSPMTNLFQMGKTRISLRTQAILRGKIYIEEIRADSIRFGTPRKFSGALPGKPPKEKKEKAEKPKSDAPPLVDLKNFNASALLDQEFDKLNSPKLYDEAISFYDETSTKYQGQVEKTSAQVKEMQTTTAPLLKLNVNEIKDIETIRSTIQNINTAVNSVQTATGEVTAVANGLENDIKKARAMEANARNSFTADLNHLKSYIDLGSGAAFASVEPFIRNALSDTANQYLDYGLMGLEVLGKLKSNSSGKPKTEKPKKERKVVFKGRDVPFPVVAYPAFYLGILASDFTLDIWNWGFDLRDVSSNPDLTNKPVTLSLGVKDANNAQKSVLFNGSADFRTNPKDLYNAQIKANGFPISMGDQLNKLGINGVKGDAAFSLNMAGQPDNSFSGGGNVVISHASLVDPSGTIGEAMSTAVKQAGNINLGLKFAHKTDGKDEFSITSNLAELFAKALRSLAEGYAKQAMADLEKALRQKIDQYINGRFGSKDQVDNLLKTVKGDKSAMDQIKNQLNAKKEEFEKKLKSQATDAAGQAVKDNLPANTPKIPGFGR